MLIHLIDISGSGPGQDPAEALRVIEEELEAYGAGLEDKPRLVALNKLDLADAELAEGFAQELLEAGAEKVFAVSGATGQGVGELLDAILAYLPAATSTETKGVEREEEPDAEDGGEGGWSPL